MSKNVLRSIQETKSSVIITYGGCDDERMSDIRRRSVRWAEIYGVKITVLSNKCAKFNNDCFPLKVHGSYKFPFTMDESKFSDIRMAVL